MMNSNANIQGWFISHYSCFTFFGIKLKKCVSNKSVSNESVSSISSTQSFFIEYNPEIDSILF